ncbi:hypothetical protein BVC80_379g15 [Macleaya cordata]|uniref:Uncharacterized protein n=1 Tax=Macleaya cordata TaxID=56857 RepID=A0A200QSR3_MACCD|nr:hypothetical protein BVC80_379g15 [Macleaya cordata]
MPTFTAIALESLLEPSLRNSGRNNNSSSSSSSSPPLKQKNKNNSNSINNSFTTKKPPKHIYISPALYTTPEPAPIPYSSADSVSPSPYVLNRKRRDLRAPEAANRLHGFEIKQGTASVVDIDDDDDDDGLVVVVANNMTGDDVDIPVPVSPPSATIQLDIVLSELEGEEGGLVEGDLRDQNPHDFVIPRGGGDSMSVTSCSCEVDDLLRHSSSSSSAAVKPTQAVASQTEFFDADEEFFSDGSVSNASPSLVSNIEELHAARVNLFDEIERRKRAENALARMRNSWQGIKTHLSRAGLSFPATGDGGEDNSQLEIDIVEQFCQEVVVARFVSEAIGKGLARAETEAAAEALMESKSLEISRLRDKLQYYEAVNHEMFQRNQEVVEIERKQRDRRKTKQRWIWSCIGLSITLGASLLAYSYLPEMSRNSPVSSADMSDVPPGTLDSS